MKTTTFALGALALVSHLAAAQPHRRHAHANRHVKKEVDVVLTITDTVYASPTEAPDVIVFVNQFGEPVSTMTEGILAHAPKAWSTKHGAHPTAAPPAPKVVATSSSSSSSSSSATTLATVVAPAPSSTSTSAAPTTTSEPAVVAPVENVQVAAVATSPVEAVAVPTTPSVAVVIPASTSSAAAVQSSAAASSGSSSGGFGLSYSPYNGDRSCKSQDEVNTDFAAIGSGFGMVRIYGTDCNQVSTVLTAAKKYGMKLFAGVYDLTEANLASQVKTIVSAANGDWSSFDTISVGNEAVNSGSFAPATVVSAIGTVRSLLKDAGYTGNVVTVDTLVAMRANPELCDASDYCAANCHPFFDGNVAAENAGDFLEEQIPTLQAVLANKNKKIVITETGWPSQGKKNNKAEPSTSNQAAALSSIKSKFTSNPSNVILFTPFNDMWKVSAASTFNAEQYWGFLGNSPSG